MRSVDVTPDDDDVDGERLGLIGRWRWYARPRLADDDGSRAAEQPQDLALHTAMTAAVADALVASLELDGPEAIAVRFAARWHDIGKRRLTWQRGVGNVRYPDHVLAKSDGRSGSRDLSGYRHELGSLIDVSRDPEFLALDSDVQDLVLHLIAAHHGRARPHFSPDESFDPERLLAIATAATRSTPSRFVRVQRRYGRWGLAYLESIVRAADALASQGFVPDDPATPVQGEVGP